MIKIPYGESDFEKIMVKDYFYQDRTAFIEKLEKWESSYLAFLRPRRFGKSLFVSTLHHYYGLEYQADFQKLFGGLYIGQHPTALANSYLVLSFEFSRIDTATHESTCRGFLTNVIEGARAFLSAYDNIFTVADKQTILSQSSPEAMVKTLFSLTNSNKIPHKIYLLIDEYDHFANELLSFDVDRFKNDVSRNGFVRKFYESLKTAAGAGIIDRIFITGISPVTLDLGMLSFKEQNDIGWRCEIPNYVIKKLYFEYFTATQLAKTRFAKATRAIAQTISALISEGNPQPFFKIVENVLQENHSNRDEMQYGEKHLQTLMIGLLCPYESYYIHSEYESRRSYPDIYLEKMPNNPVKYDIVLELKYVKKSKVDTLKTVIEEAQTQLNEYRSSERFARPDVRGFYVVFLGGAVHEWREYKG